MHTNTCIINLLSLSCLLSPVIALPATRAIKTAVVHTTGILRGVVRDNNDGTEGQKHLLPEDWLPNVDSALTLHPLRISGGYSSVTAEVKIHRSGGAAGGSSAGGGARGTGAGGRGSKSSGGSKLGNTSSGGRGATAGGAAGGVVGGLAGSAASADVGNRTSKGDAGHLLTGSSAIVLFVGAVGWAIV
ncbi:hypothetical protein BKA67DRAFT_654633 [Truncatella angustata]|uniref:Uncharacterized protein n=1 Tax=Truncatella angustata TaxID=152316 RepID=A0A9P8UQB5_9PEZI|nr:uncharacterized protein BKA67DRAFT_654633 [Truncatella angustata]KAH6656288.1 hypothetical protein BKA67DRAFT_654633 [Truncatella angustata]KAH8202146.1 hypothetical protein TruAng_003724 [Truncatella angustata]